MTKRKKIYTVKFVTKEALGTITTALVGLDIEDLNITVITKDNNNAINKKSLVGDSVDTE